MGQPESRMSNLRSARAQWRRGNPMAAHDRLPTELRQWLIHAALPWSAESALRLWNRAMRETRCPVAARERLANAEARTLAREKGLLLKSKYCE
jgi:hypothetical protein